MSIEKEFKINEFLSLTLKDEKTYIIVAGKEFKQCKYVLINIPVDNINQYSSINSIDEVLGVLDHSLETTPRIIPPDVEFWAHCSNLQAWAENDYNTDVLSSVLAFPLLKMLTEEEDLQAKKVLKEEIAKRLMRGEIRLANYLYDIKIMVYLTEEELISVVSSDDCGLFGAIFSAFKNIDSENFSEAFTLYEKIGKYLLNHIEKKLNQILDTKNVEDLCIFINYRMLDILSNDDILSFFEHPMDLLSAILKILNELEIYEYKIIEDGVFSRRVVKILGKKIREKLLPILQEGGVKYDLLSNLHLLPYLKEEDYNLLI